MIEIVLCTDDNYVMPTGVCMYSICKNNENGIVHFHIVSDCELSTKTKESFNHIAQIFNNRVEYYIYDIQQENVLVGQKGQIPHITASTYLRILLPKILPNSLNKVLYIDGDIICRHSLMNLWNTSIEGYSIAGVKEGYYDYSLHNGILLEKKYDYINAGVLLINLKDWRQNHRMETCLEFMHKYPERCLLLDQDIINFTLKDHKYILPVRYNLTSAYLLKGKPFYWKDRKEIAKAISDPVLIHYTGSAKPWNYVCPHPFVNLFRNYQDETEWKGVRTGSRPSRLRSLKCFVIMVLNKILGDMGKPLEFVESDIQW